MISSEIFIIKRDGKKEAFSLDKIKNAISKAFLSVGSHLKIGGLHNKRMLFVTLHFKIGFSYQINTSCITRELLWIK